MNNPESCARVFDDNSINFRGIVHIYLIDLCFGVSTGFATHPWKVC